MARIESHRQSCRVRGLGRRLLISELRHNRSRPGEEIAIERTKLATRPLVQGQLLDLEPAHLEHPPHRETARNEPPRFVTRVCIRHEAYVLRLLGRGMEHRAKEHLASRCN